ncbi:MAG: phosphotransferase [Melioribacteraceae bacterium]|nr:phosphotransferase [Melioribacteraceae bacterium]
MKISLLLKREPFFKILIETLESYFKLTYNKDVNLKIKKRSLFGTSNNKLFCNSKINVFFTKNNSEDQFGQIVKEYSHNPNIIKKWLQIIYLKLAVNFPFAKYYSDFSLTITPFFEELNNFLIYGGNHRIRIIDYKNNRSVVILKVGSRPSFLTNEIELRNENRLNGIPKLLEFNEEQRWFTEEIISGTPINRTSSTNIVDNSFLKAIEILENLQNRSKESLCIDSYIKELSKEIDEIILNKIFDSIREGVLDLKKILIEKIGRQSDRLNISLTHGDFQAANILFEGSKVWLIDWENAKKRNINYDYLTFLTDARTISIFKKSFIILFNRSEDNLKNDYPYLSFSLPIKLSLKIFLIENLIFALEQNNNENFYDIDDYLTQYIQLTTAILNEIDNE